MIFITGCSGFVGKSIMNYFTDEEFFKWSRGMDFYIDSSSIVIHLAGKVHDLKKSINSDEYYRINTELTKKVFDAFLVSNARVFITLSSVKAVADNIDGELNEDQTPNPLTHYGKSKLLAEKYIFSRDIPLNKRVYVLRPSIIHGPGNKGNLNFLYNFVSLNIPWPLGAFENKRSFCSIDNLLFIIKELIEREDVPTGIYNISDDNPISTNELISLIAQSQNRKIKIWKISKRLIKFFARVGDKFPFLLNTERLHKLTASFVVSNSKIKYYINKPLPVSCRDGLIISFQSFNS